MTEPRIKNAATVLQWTLGVVILIESILFVLPSARHDFGQTHMPDLVRLILGWAEIAGSLLMLIPRTATRGAWLLIGVFILAMVIHLLHGMPNIGNLLIYTAAAWVISVAK
jgi:DoxX-like family